MRGPSQLRAEQIGVGHYDSLFPFGGGAAELVPLDSAFGAFFSDVPEVSLDFDSDAFDSDAFDSDAFDSDDFDSPAEPSPLSFLPLLDGSALRCAFLP
jgi:hypothetical protein